MTSASKSWPFWTQWERSRRVAFAMVAMIGLGLTGYLLAGLPVLYLPAILAGVGFLFLSLRSPLIGLCVVLSFLFLPVRIGGFTILQAVGVVVTVTAVLWSGISRKSAVFPTSVWPIFAYIILTLHSLSFTRDSATTLSALRKLLVNAFLCLLIVNIIDTYKKLRPILIATVGMVVLNAVVAISQQFLGLTREFRARGLFENENEFGGAAAAMLFVPFYLFLYEEKRSRRYLWLFLSAVLAGGMLSSVSRGALLSFLCGLAFVSVRERKFRIRIAVLAALGVLFFAVLPEHIYQRFGNLGTDVRRSVQVNERIGLTARGYFNRAGMSIWKTHPVWGVGLGNYGFYYVEPEYNPGLKRSERVVAHNLYVQTLAETGVVGFAVLCVWILSSFANFLLAERRALNPLDVPYIRGIQVLMLVLLISSASSGSLTYGPMVFALALSEVCRRCGQGAGGVRPPQGLIRTPGCRTLGSNELD